MSKKTRRKHLNLNNKDPLEEEWEVWVEWEEWEEQEDLEDLTWKP